MDKLLSGGVIKSEEIDLLMSRVLPFKSVHNFRELGGYAMKDGRKIKKGLFYRCGALGDIKSEEDLALLDSLNLKYILDLRSEQESAEIPDLTLQGARYERLPGMTYEDGSECDFSPQGMERFEKEIQAYIALHPEAIKNPLEMTYARMPFNNDAYKHLFKAIKQREVPLVFHCTAGKDRTGIASMLILLALGADKETLLKDYMTTNLCRRQEIMAMIEKYEDEITSGREPISKYIGWAGVDINAILTSLNKIEERYANIEEYFLKELDMTSEDLAWMRSEFLEY